MVTVNGLENLGYTPEVAQEAEPYISEGYIIARVTQELRQRYLIRTEALEVSAEVSGRMMHRANTRSDFPVVGDWVAVTLHDNNSHAIIHHILPRKTILQRRSPGKRIEQHIIATNIDAVFILLPLNQEWTRGTLERYLILVRQSGAQPYVLLSKRDLCTEEKANEIIKLVESVVNSSELILSYSLYCPEDIAHISSLLRPGVTFCLLGPSGAGKSSLINALVGKEILATGEVRSYDAKGRHVTTIRQLVVLEAGGILIDTPGLRELGLWEIEDGLIETFDDIVTIAEGCRFRDCTHTHEPDCAVRKAVEEGELSSERYQNYIRYQKELLELSSAIDPGKRKKQRELEKKRIAEEKSKYHRRNK
ncbi:MAG TPA: ribosome small subunit-dependent GTPase A [Bacteroidota bacterium]|nr:ribosome small subunit-dependent GTPase A [Bacteroidota bacterium]